MAARGQQYALKATFRDGSIAPIPDLPVFARERGGSRGKRRNLVKPCPQRAEPGSAPSAASRANDRVPGVGVFQMAERVELPVSSSRLRIVVSDPEIAELTSKLGRVAYIAPARS